MNVWNGFKRILCYGAKGFINDNWKFMRLFLSSGWIVPVYKVETYLSNLQRGLIPKIDHKKCLMSFYAMFNSLIGEKNQNFSLTIPPFY